MTKILAPEVSDTNPSQHVHDAPYESAAPSRTCSPFSTRILVASDRARARTTWKGSACMLHDMR